MLDYVYAAMWFIAGLLMVFRFSKDNKVFIPTGCFFVILGLWWLLNALTPIDMFTGTLGWVLRALTVATLVFLVLSFVKSRKRDAAAQKEADAAKPAAKKELGNNDKSGE